MQENEFEEESEIEYYEEQENLYNEIPQEPVQDIDLSDAIPLPEQEISDEIVNNELDLGSSLQDFITNEEEYYEPEPEYYEDNDFIEVENYIEVNEDTLINFNDWMYDAIINKTLIESQKDYNHDISDLLIESKRDSNGFLSLIHLESREYRYICRYMEKAYNYSYSQEKRVYIRTAHNQFLKSFRELINTMVRDERYTMF